MFQSTPSMSNVWRGITDNVSWLKKRAATAVGNGRHTLFWDHVWATKGPLRDLITRPVPMALEGATVEEMWLGGHGWKWEVFADYLPVHAVQAIASHSLVEDPEVADLVYWKGSKTGEFSIKYAMQLMREPSSLPSNPKWEKAWQGSNSDLHLARSSRSNFMQC